MDKSINKCKVCQVETKNKHYCSMKCRDVSRKNESFMISKCKTCGNDFSHRKYRNQMYCSLTCSANNEEVNTRKVQSAKITCVSKYGVDSHTKTDEYKEKMKSVFTDKYGVDHYSKTDKYKEKFKNTMLERYGVEYAQQNDEIKKKSVESALINFGGAGFASIEISKKIKNSINRLYGVENATQSKDVMDKIKKTNIERYGFDTPLRDVDKMQKCIEKKYGVKNISQTKENKMKMSDKLRENFLESVFSGGRLVGICEPLFTKDEYLNSDRDNGYKFKCKNCSNDFTDHLSNGHIPKCPICFPYTKSKCELEIIEFIKLNNNGLEVIHNTRSILPNGKELDIYIPSKKLAIEFNGVKWHSENFGGKMRNYHLNKTIECDILGIKLIHIFDSEWDNKQDIIKRKIMNLLHVKDSKSIYARNCEIKEITQTESNRFLIDNHIQGSDKSSIKLGAFHNGMIVSVMTFGCARVALGSKISVIDEYEMYRFCVGKNNIIGIAGKLLSYFIKNYKPSKIVTFADIRYSGLNAMYDKIGFVKVKQSTPNYWYFHKNSTYKLYHRYNFRKSELLKKLPIFDVNLTEWENMKNNGYDRIWDCGNLKYEWKK